MPSPTDSPAVEPAAAADAAGTVSVQATDTQALGFPRPRETVVKSSLRGWPN